MLVGKSDPSITDTLSTLRSRPCESVTPRASSAAIAQTPITCALTTVACGGFISSASICALAEHHDSPNA
jgi:hypothetical protein